MVSRLLKAIRVAPNYFSTIWAMFFIAATVWVALNDPTAGQMYAYYAYGGITGMLLIVEEADGRFWEGQYEKMSEAARNTLSLADDQMVVLDAYDEVTSREQKEEVERMLEEYNEQGSEGASVSGEVAE